MVEIKGDRDVTRSEGVGAEQEAASTPSTPTQCPQPTCRSKEIAKLNQRAGMQLWECGKCLHGWETPLPGFNAVAVQQVIENKERHEARRLGRRKPETGLKAKEKNVASSEVLKCRKGCGKEFVHPKRRQNHEGGCLGGGKKAATKKPSAPAATKPATGGAIGEALAQLRIKRQELLAAVPGLAKLDEAIRALEGVEADPS
jgi:hypothetical protein